MSTSILTKTTSEFLHSREIQETCTVFKSRNYKSSVWIVAAMLLFSVSAFGAGVTVITHGYNSGTSGWVSDMANAIADRTGGISAVTQYTLVIGTDIVLGPAKVQSFKRDANSPALENTSTGEIIIKVDWSDIDAGVPCENLRTTGVIANVLANALLNPPTEDRALIHIRELPIHLIGHSRGGSLMAQTAGLLGQQGIWIEQLTTLDPHPVSCFLPGVESDSPVRAYDNIIFADNYRQTEGISLPDFHGQAVEGAFLVDLNAIVKPYSSGLNPFPGYAHVQVHTFYHATIDTNRIGEVDGTRINESWYDTRLQASRQSRDMTGFYFSRIAGGERPSTGIGYWWGGPASRVPIRYESDTHLSPNIFFEPRKGGNSLDANEVMTIRCWYSAARSRPEII